MGRELFPTLLKCRILTTAARHFFIFDGSTTAKTQKQDDWYATLAPKLGVKPHVTANEQPSVEATHKYEAPVVILNRAFRGVGKAFALAYGKAGCKVLVSYVKSCKEAEDVCKEVVGEPVSMSNKNMFVYSIMETNFKEKTGVDASNRDRLPNRFLYVSIMEIPPFREWFKNHSLWAILTGFCEIFCSSD
ncbi:ketoacyl-ACP reductase 2 [Artemisia annua]|uniref:Ketoacyl-ACP reductase 2 n=1 Tax=Artemisia annua TaxID=35608 RepID=A0A2U1LB74_ARTAN|nr:ketoacyl-ACP reductase 2 [Artemisia annua]